MSADEVRDTPPAPPLLPLHGARARNPLLLSHPRTLFTLPYDANLVVDSGNLQRRPQYWRGNGHAAGFAEPRLAPGAVSSGSWRIQ